MGSESSTIFTDLQHLTPTGAAFQYAIDNQYVTKEEFMDHPMVYDGLGITINDRVYSTSYVDTLLMRASAWVNRYTNRHFDVQTVDEVRSNVMLRGANPFLLTIYLNEAPINKINSIYVQYLDSFTPFSLTYLQNFNPLAGSYKIIPSLAAGGGMTSPLPGSIIDQGGNANIWTNYQFGYTVLPADVKEAVIMKAALLYANQRNPLGVTQFKTGDMTMQWDIKNNGMDNQICSILDHYKRTALGAV